MSDHDLTIVLSLPSHSPVETYDAINDVASWWSGTIDGDPLALGEEFVYNYGDAHRSVQRVTTLEPGARVEWLVSEANLPAVEPTDEWAGTTIRFELVPLATGGTELRFTHVGLTPACSCYDRCTSGWDALIERNLRRRIETGAAQPDVFQALA